MKFTNGDQVTVLSGEYAGLTGIIGGYDVDKQEVEVIFDDSLGALDQTTKSVMMKEDNLVLHNN